MDLYHGTHKYFEKFDLSHKGSGEGASLLIGHGVYLTESPLVGDAYRQRTADPRYFGTMPSLWEGGSRLEFSDVPEEDRDQYETQYGSVFKVGGVEPTSLIDWDGCVEDQPFDVLELLRGLYDQSELDAIDDFIAQAEEAEDISFQFDVEEVVEKVMLYGPSYTADLMQDCSRDDVKWDQLISLIANRALDLPEDDSYGAGARVYGLLDSHLGSEELAAEWLSQRGIHGVVANLELPLGDAIPKPHEGARTVVYWRVEDLVIKEVLSPMALEGLRIQEPTNNPFRSASDSSYSPSF